MCVSIKAPAPPPAPEPIPEAPPSVSNATTSQTAPNRAVKRDAGGSAVSGSSNTATASRKRLGRGSLRIPLTSSGLSGSGLNFPTA